MKFFLWKIFTHFLWMDFGSLWINFKQILENVMLSTIRTKFKKVVKKSSLLIFGLISLTLSQPLFASDQDITINFELTSPIAFTSITAGNLGILDITLVTNNHFISYDTTGAVTFDNSNVFISGTTVAPSVGITGDSGSVIDISLSETALDTSGIDFSTFKCSTDSATAASCGVGENYTMTGSGVEQTLAIGFVVQGDNVENASPTIGTKVSSITVSAVYQ
jgi:hypothetical protein